MEILNYLDKFNWQTIIGMFAICWYFTHDLKVGMKQIDEDINKQGERIDAQGARTDKLYEMFVELLKHEKK